MLCRLCLIESAPLLDLFDTEDPALSRAHILCKHFWFEVEPNDRISTFACRACWNKVDDFHQFYMSVEAAHAAFYEAAVGTESLASDLDETERPIEDFLIEEVYTEEDDELEDLPEDTNDEVDEIMDAEDELEEYEQLLPDTEETNQSSPTTGELENSTESVTQAVASESKCKRLSEKDSQLVKKYIDMDCDLCDFVGVDYDEITVHFKLRHKDQLLPYVKCCGVKLDTSNALLLHALKHENPDIFKCSFCEKAFARLQYLRKHVMIVHASEEDLKFECEHCDKRFSMEYLLKEHTVMHVPKVQQAFRCDKCPGKSFASKRRLRIHAARHTKPKPSSYLCHVCAKVFRSKAQHDKHIRQHNGIIAPRKKCPIPGCYKSLANRNTLRLHMLTHQNAMLQCDECGSISSTAAGLAVHKNNMHKSTKLYNCDICGKNFKLADVLKDHQAMHAGLKLNKCRFCERTFTFRSNMYTHMGKLHKVQYDKWRRAQHQISGVSHEEAQTTSKKDKSKRLAHS